MKCVCGALTVTSKQGMKPREKEKKHLLCLGDIIASQSIPGGRWHWLCPAGEETEAW